MCTMCFVIEMLARFAPLMIVDYISDQKIIIQNGHIKIFMRFLDVVVKALSHMN